VGKTLDATQNGITYAKAGDTVTLTPAPASNQRFKGWTSSEVTVNEDNTFTMPNSSVTMTASFTKADTASGYALDALRWAVEKGIISGYGDGRLDPQGQATCVQAAAMLQRYLEKTR